MRRKCLLGEGCERLVAFRIFDDCIRSGRKGLLVGHRLHHHDLLASSARNQRGEMLRCTREENSEKCCARKRWPEGGDGVTSVVGHCERRLSVDEARTPDRIGLCLTNSSSSESES